MTEIVVAQRMWQRRDTAANWTTVNPVLAAGEIGVELGALPSDTRFKIGDGVTAWTGLPYMGLPNVFVAEGDLMYAGAAGNPVRLPIGAEGKSLRVVSGKPAWVDGEGGGGAGAAPVTELTIAPGGVVNLDCSAGRLFRLPLTENVTDFSFSGIDVGEGVDLVIEIEQGDPARYVGWPSSFLWPQRQVVPVSVIPGSLDLLRLANLGVPDRWLASLQTDFGGRGILGTPLTGANLQSYSVTYEGLGADGTVFWGIVGGSLPRGLHVVQNGTELVQIAGVPNNATPGDYSVLLRYTDQYGSFVERLLTFTVTASPSSLLHLDGTTGSTTITDVAGPTWTVTGTGGSIQNDEVLLNAGNWRNTGTGRFRTTDTTLRNIGTQAVTISFWAKMPAPPETQCVFMFGNDSSTASRVCGCFIYANGTVGLYGTAVKNSQAMSDANAVTTSPGDFPFDQVVHVEISMSAVVSGQRTFRIFINGEKKHEQTATGATLNASGLTWGYGYYTAQRTYVGRLDEIAVTIGAVAHTDNFEPPLTPSNYPQTPAPLEVTGSLPPASSASPYASTTDITIYGAGAPYSVAVVSGGSLPSGWSAVVSGANVHVTGPAGTTPGTYNFILRVTDAASSPAVDLPLSLLVTA